MSLHLVTGYEGAEHIQSQDQGSFNIAAFGGGQYVLDHGYKFAASLLAGNTVNIKDGDMLIQGRHVRLAAGQTEDVTYDYGTTGMLRKDLYVPADVQWYGSDTLRSAVYCERRGK